MVGGPESFFAADYAMDDYACAKDTANINNRAALRSVIIAITMECFKSPENCNYPSHLKLHLVNALKRKLHGNKINLLFSDPGKKGSTHCANLRDVKTTLRFDCKVSNFLYLRRDHQCDTVNIRCVN
jgi:hypothetical protein